MKPKGKLILATVLGLVLFLVFFWFLGSDTVFAQITNPAPNQLVDIKDFGSLLKLIIQIMLGFAGAIAVIFLMVGGFQYVASRGNEEAVEKAKKTITYSVVGIVVIVMAFAIVAIVNTLLTGPPPAPGSPPSNTIGSNATGTTGNITSGGTSSGGLTISKQSEVDCTVGVSCTENNLATVTRGTTPYHFFYPSLTADPADTRLPPQGFSITISSQTGVLALSGSSNTPLTKDILVEIEDSAQPPKTARFTFTLIVSARGSSMGSANLTYSWGPGGGSVVCGVGSDCNVLVAKVSGTPAYCIDDGSNSTVCIAGIQSGLPAGFDLELNPATGDLLIKGKATSVITTQNISVKIEDASSPPKTANILFDFQAI